MDLGRARSFLSRSCRGDAAPNRGEAALVEQLPRNLSRVRTARPETSGVALDFSPATLEKARERFADDGRTRVIEHDLTQPVPDLGAFDAVVSSFAIHHLEDARKRELCEEVFGLLVPGGVFCNLEHVSSPAERLHGRFLAAIGYGSDDEDPSNRLLEVGTQLRWLREVGFTDVDCHWKWLELALLGGAKPG